MYDYVCLCIHVYAYIYIYMYIHTSSQKCRNLLRSMLTAEGMAFV